MKFLFCIIALLSITFLLVAPVSAYDFTLSVYGNANMDDIIDEEDVTYLKGIISGVNEKTQFADANYDNIINEADISQIESIISGDPVILTLVDNQGMTGKVNTPVKSNANLFLGSVRPVVQLNSIDSIVGIGTTSGLANKLIFKAHPELKDIPEVGTGQEPNQEAILSVNPDVIYGGFFTSKEIAQALSQNTRIPFVYAAPKEVASFDKDDGAYETWRFVGLLQGNDDLKRAEELIEYSNEKIKAIEDITSQVPENEKPKVYFACYASPTMTSTYYQPIDIAGGINVAKDLPVGTSGWGGIDVSKEQIIEWNPDVILVHAGTKEDDGKHGSIDGILHDPALQSVNAVKNERVYGTKGWDTGWDSATGLCECYYLAKLFYPDLFTDLNVEKECNEILEEFYGVSGLYDWMVENCGSYVTWR